MTFAENDLFSLLWWLAEMLLLSFGLWLIGGKMGYRRRWMFWVPGARYIALGDALDMDADGMICGILEILATLLRFVNLEQFSESVSIILSLLILVAVVFRLVFRLRLAFRLTAVFNASRKWAIGWLLAEWLPALCFGLKKKYQPRMDLLPAEEWKAGTAPAAIAGTGRKTAAAETGLSIDVRERVARDFGKKRYLLKDISLDIPNGSMVLLLGGSGSGKTTFVNAVIGYEKADAEIVLNGTDVYKDYDRMKYRIGFVPQQNLIRGNDTVVRTVTDAAEMRLPANVRTETRNGKVKEVMDLLGLTAGCDGLVSKKSGGQLRRISIAMELVTDPELFVLDEPDSGLDGVIAREIFTKLRSIADEGKIVIVITHTPDRVIDLFDKVIVLARDSGRVGRLAFYGSPEEAREFFGKDTMEGIVMSVNRKEEGGDGMADEFIARYAKMTEGEEMSAS